MPNKKFFEYEKENIFFKVEKYDTFFKFFGGALFSSGIFKIGQNLYNENKLRNCQPTKIEISKLFGRQPSNQLFVIQGDDLRYIKVKQCVHPQFKVANAGEISKKSVKSLDTFYYLNEIHRYNILYNCKLLKNSQDMSFKKASIYLKEKFNYEKLPSTDVQYVRVNEYYGFGGNIVGKFKNCCYISADKDWVVSKILKSKVSFWVSPMLVVIGCLFYQRSSFFAWNIANWDGYYRLPNLQWDYFRWKIQQKKEK